MADNKPPRREQRKLRDADTLRALTHPTRVALIEELAVAGSLTATEAGEQIGESPSSCSFHLRQLAKYGLVEEAGGGQGRARPWRLRFETLDIGSTPGDAESELAAAAFGRMVVDRMLERHETWRQTRGSYPQTWRDAGFETEALNWLTPDELGEIKAAIREVIDRPEHEARRTDPSARPPGTLPVELLVFGYPVAPPRAEPDAP